MGSLHHHNMIYQCGITDLDQPHDRRTKRGNQRTDIRIFGMVLPIGLHQPVNGLLDFHEMGKPQFKKGAVNLIIGDVLGELPDHHRWEKSHPVFEFLHQ